MPKANGPARPLGIPALEDKLVPLACAKLWPASYAQDLLECRYGYRAGRGAVDAVCALTCDLPYGRYGYLVEADIKGFGEPMAPPWLLDRLRWRIADRALLPLMRKWLKAGTLDTDGPVVHPAPGTPQGGTVAPVLANGSLHSALDLWFEKVVQPRGRGEAGWCRSADAWVWALRWQEDAERFWRVLPPRLAPCHLQVAPETTQLCRFRRLHPSTKRRFTLLGCAFFWAPERPGVPRVMRRTARQKLQAACQRLTAWIKHPRPLPGRVCFQRVKARLRGHDNY
jgi:retron-type reverse transcriptase